MMRRSISLAMALALALAGAAQAQTAWPSKPIKIIVGYAPGGSTDVTARIIGQALSEGTQLDENGRHRNAHLTDYKLVTASDAPKIDVAWIETDTPSAGPKGSKGVGTVAELYEIYLSQQIEGKKRSARMSNAP